MKNDLPGWSLPERNRIAESILNSGTFPVSPISNSYPQIEQIRQMKRKNLCNLRIHCRFSSKYSFIIGTKSAEVVQIPCKLSAMFSDIGALRSEQPNWFREDLGALFDLLAQGKIKPSIERLMKLTEAMEAHKLIEQAVVEGRIVLTVNGG